jgi:hypothetical protein
MNLETKILNRMKRNRKINSWWVNLFIKYNGKNWLQKKGLTPQAIGVWCNLYTSNSERISILKRAAPTEKK